MRQPTLEPSGCFSWVHLSLCLLVQSSQCPQKPSPLLASGTSSDSQTDVPHLHLSHPPPPPNSSATQGRCQPLLLTRFPCSWNPPIGRTAPGHLPGKCKLQTFQGKKLNQVNKDNPKENISQNPWSLPLLWP